MAMFRKPLLATALLVAIALPGAAFAQSALTVKFTDPAWDGKTVPKTSTCSIDGNTGAMTPALEVSGVPDGTVKITESFNDETYEPMDHGGHGVLGFDVKPEGGIAQVPSAPGESDQLPAGVTVVAKNKGTGNYDKPGWLPPCSGGHGNLYTMDVSALDASGASLATAHVELGHY
jgi:hypothetical protein